MRLSCCAYSVAALAVVFGLGVYHLGALVVGGGGALYVLRGVLRVLGRKRD